jgi:ribonuclease G
MTDTILTSAHIGETRVALLADGKVEALHFFRDLTPHLTGNIYWAVIRRLAPEFEGVFLELEPGLDAFLAVKGKSAEGLTEGQKLLVQVKKEAAGDKPAEVTRKIDLTGRATQFQPLGKVREISAAIEKSRKAELAEFLKGFENISGGIRLRAAAATTSHVDLAAELAAAQELWVDIQQAAGKVKAPRCLIREASPALRFLRDHLGGDIQKVIFDRAATLAEARNYLGPETPPLTLHKGGEMFSDFGVDAVLASLFDARIPLSGGGWIAIEETEALTAIDVNAGSPIKNQGAAELGLSTNREAAREIARQLRLRQIGGLVVVDFIDMPNAAYGQILLEDFDAFLKTDPFPVRRTGFSAFGLIELTRKKTGPSLIRQLAVPAALKPTLETSGLSALRLAEQTGKVAPGRPLVIESDGATAHWLEERRPALLAELQRRIGAEVKIKPREDFARGDTNAYNE